jgi:hypothetical protein
MITGIRRIAPWLIATAAIAVSCVSFDAYYRRTAEVARLRERIDRNRQESSRVILELRKQLVAVKTAAPAVPPPSRKEGESAGTLLTSRVITEAIQEAERKDPAHARLWKKQCMRTIMNMYGDAIAALKLPPDKFGKLKDLLFEQLQATYDAMDAAKEAGLTAGESNQAAMQSRNEIDAEIKALLGADAFAQFQQDSMAGTFKSVINSGVGADMAVAGTPLTPEQLTALSRLYAQTVNPGLKHFGTQNTDPVTGLTSRNQWLLDQSAGFLNPGQLQSMRQSLLDGQENQQLLQQVKVSQGGG